VPIALFRVDERLIHGQVTVAWGARLAPDHYLVVDDLLADAGWEQELYRLGTPSGVEVSFLAVAEAADRLEEWAGAGATTVLLTRDLPTMARLVAAAPGPVSSVNLGGIHHAPGRDRVLPFVSLGDAERSAIQTLLDAGVAVEARDLPGTPAVDARTFVE
jgi:mannose/fructose/N-acetylgalactosamine-specific phosphotransferase system component IIB